MKIPRVWDCVCELVQEENMSAENTGSPSCLKGNMEPNGDTPLMQLLRKGRAQATGTTSNSLSTHRTQQFLDSVLGKQII